MRVKEILLFDKDELEEWAKQVKKAVIQPNCPDCENELYLSISVETGVTVECASCGHSINFQPPQIRKVHK